MEKASEFQKNIYFCFINYTKALTVWITANSEKFLKRQEYQTTLPVSWKTYMQVKKQKLELDMDKHTGPKLGKEYKAGYCHSAFICRVHHEKCLAGWITKLESRLPGEIATTSDIHMIPL